MFLAGDESISHNKKVYGFVCSERTLCYEFESKVCQVRMEHQLWGEVKLQKLPSTSNRLFQAYIDFVDLFLDTKGIQYYSIAYLRPNTPRLRTKGYSEQYIADLRDTFHGRMIFLLARHIAERLHEVSLDSDLVLLGDQSTTLNKEWSIIRELMNDKSKRVRQKVANCTFGNSAVSSYIQLSDLVTGLISSKSNNNLNAPKRKLLEHIEQKLGYGIGLNDPVRYSKWGFRKVNTWHFSPTPKY